MLWFCHCAMLLSCDLVPRFCLRFCPWLSYAFSSGVVSVETTEPAKTVVFATTVVSLPAEGDVASFFAIVVRMFLTEADMVLKSNISAVLYMNNMSVPQFSGPVGSKDLFSL